MNGNALYKEYKSNLMSYLLLFTILIIAILSPMALQAEDLLTQLNSNNDQGFWLECNGKIDLKNKGTFLMLHTEFRWGADYKKFWHEEYEFVLLHTFVEYKKPCYTIKSFSMGPGYNGTYTLKKNTRGIFNWVWVNRTIAEAHLSSEKDDWDIKQRLKIEYHDFTKPHYKNFGSFRYRIAVFTPWKYTCLKLNPFVSNEWFFRKNTYSKSYPTGLVGGWYENRFRAGIDTTFSERLSSAIYFQWKIDRLIPGSIRTWNNTYQSCVAFLVKY